MIVIAPIEAPVGSPVTLEGYADDYGNHICSIEFSLDGGRTWTAQDTSASNPNLMIHWTYTFTPEVAGAYQVMVRSVTDDGRKSPEAAVAVVNAF